MTSIKSSNGNELDLDLTETPYTIWDSENLVCHRALKRLEYNLLVDSDGSVIIITATASVVDVTSETRSIQQEFRITFTPVEITAPKSGNPGYEFSFPTLAGKMMDDGATVDSSSSGFTVTNIGNDAGNCLATSKSYVSNSNSCQG